MGVANLIIGNENSEGITLFVENIAVIWRSVDDGPRKRVAFGVRNQGRQVTDDKRRVVLVVVESCR